MHEPTRRAPATPPTGTVTFLFTDIVGSTEQWEKHGDAFLPVLQAHNAIIMDSISRFGGYLMKTEGDAFKIAFADPAAAAKCAVVAQAALQRYPWPSDVAAVQVRMAIHTGNPFFQANDYFGPPLNRTARILSTVHGGQIVISEDTLNRIEHKMDADSRFIDLGFHQLKDLDEPARLHQLEHPRLEHSNFPPPRSLNAHAHNLPRQRRSFVGREKEIERIASELASGDERLITITGGEGIGKTRLSLQVAAEEIERYPDGVAFISLTGTVDTMTAIHHIAKELAITIPEGADPIDTVRQELADRRFLLILDDCGHVPQADRLIKELLSGAASLRCLATSRVPLQEGSVIPVPPMEVPSLESNAAELMATEGGRLFVERASEARSDFEINDKRAKPISSLLKISHGFPGIIERITDVIKTTKGVTPEVLDTVSNEVLHGAEQFAVKGRDLLERVKKTPAFGAFMQSIGSSAEKAELAQAERFCRDELAFHQANNNKPGIANCLWTLGKMASAQNDLSRSITLLSAALDAATELGSKDIELISVDLAYARRAKGSLETAPSIPLEQAVRIALQPA